MEEEKKDDADISKEADEGVDSNTTDEESLEDVKTKLAKAEELAKNQKIRAEKAEGKLKETKKEVPEVKPEVKEEKDDLNSKDLYALMENKVSQDDVDEVVKASKVLGKSIPEVLKDEVMKGILARRVEERKTAEATNTGGSKRVSTKVTGESLVQQANKGEMPDSDEDIDKLVAHEMELRKKAAKEGK